MNDQPLPTAAELTAHALAPLLGELRAKVYADARAAGYNVTEALAYADVIATYLGLAVSNFARRSSNLCTWEPQGQKPIHTFTRQAIQMAWDYCEVNPLGLAGFMATVEAMAKTIKATPAGPVPGRVKHKMSQMSWEDDDV